MKLPNFKQAQVDIRKLRDYCLNMKHPVGKHKARIFKQRLRLTRKDSKILKTVILDKISHTKAIEVFRDEFGIRYRCDIEIDFHNKTAVVVTIWIIRHNETHPRLVTCYIKT